jgi:periodic tryptophan protein 1
LLFVLMEFEFWFGRFRYILASGSVDQTVMLWDMNEGKVATTLKAHNEKVQAMQWHPFEMQTLLTGCCDK